MAGSPSPASSASQPRSRLDSDNDRGLGSPGADANDGPDDVVDAPVELLVEHLLAAKRSLSSITLVLRANDLATHARQLHEDAVILSAHTIFLRQGISEQVRILYRVRKGMTRAYDSGRREFKHLLRTLDGANGRLEQTMSMLREKVVERVFRPEGEERKSLIDFVDDKAVDKLRNALKDSIAELQAAQTSFDGDLLRLDTDLRMVNKTMSSSPSPPSPSSSNAYQPIPHLLASLTTHSQAMAEHLASLTRHFDMCVTAVRTTEGGAALALRKAAEATQGGSYSGDGGYQVSISGVIAEQESHVAELEPMSARERAEIVSVVVQDAPEVDEVVAELNAVLHQMETDFLALKDQADQIRAAYLATITAFHVLEEVGSRLHSYVAAEAEFVQRWEDEKDVIFIRLEEMDELRHFYEGYASAYESLLLEVERRRSVEDKIQNILRKARDNVDRLIEADRKEREVFRREIGDFLPTDLWIGMNDPLRRWEFVPVDPGLVETPRPATTEGSTPALDRNTVDAAKERMGKTNGLR